jgi:hypothetical protein
MGMKRLLRVEWDAIAGIVAALVALIMHFLHILELNVLLMIFVVLMALLFIRDLRATGVAVPRGQQIGSVWKHAAYLAPEGKG